MSDAHADGAHVQVQPRHGLADFLVDRDVGCPGCGFNLRGLMGNRCPECNTKIQLIIAQPDNCWRLRRWTLAVAIFTALSATASIISVVSLYVQWGATTANWRVLMGACVNLGMLLALVIVLVRYFLRRDRMDAPARLLASLLCALLISSVWSLVANLLWLLF